MEAEEADTFKEVENPCDLSTRYKIRKWYGTDNKVLLRLMLKQEL
jgi:hypothetical protein